MNVRCLTSNEVSLLLNHLAGQPNGIEGELAKVVEGARSWELRVICQSLFLARHLGADGAGLVKIDRIYRMGCEMAMEVEEGSTTLVEYLLRHVRDASESLDDALITIAEGFWEHDYERALRY
jgi:hypothetical protein